MARMNTDNDSSDIESVADVKVTLRTRQEVRLKSGSAPATLCATTGEQMDVQIKDVSRNGIGLVTTSSLAVGSSVVLVRGAMTINGIVTHCAETSLEEYFAGIKIIRIVDTYRGKEV